MIMLWQSHAHRSPDEEVYRRDFDPVAFDVKAEGDLFPTDPSIKAATTVAGVVDRQTNVVDPQGEYVDFARVAIWRTEPDTTFRYLTNAGGGWGAPLDRDPERVSNDVRDEYLAIAGAYEHYGVVITGDPVEDPERLMIDFEATTRRRAEPAEGG